MLEREIIIAELWRRLSLVTGVVYTARNPKAPPSIDNLPAIQFFELGDEVVEKSTRSGYPIYKRKLTIVIEPFIAAPTEAAATKELGAFVQLVKIQIYTGGNNLSKKCAEISEVDCSRILRPPAGEHTIGIGLAFEILYVEKIVSLFP